MGGHRPRQDPATTGCRGFDDGEEMSEFLLVTEFAEGRLPEGVSDAFQACVRTALQMQGLAVAERSNVEDDESEKE